MYLGPVIVGVPGRPVKGAARVASVTGDHLGRQAGSHAERAGFDGECTASPVLVTREVRQGAAREVRQGVAPEVRRTRSVSDGCAGHLRVLSLDDDEGNGGPTGRCGRIR